MKRLRVERTGKAQPVSNEDMRLKRLFGVPLLVSLAVMAGCILRPGMNAACTWPPEGATALDLADAGHARHLVLDAELIEELVDRYRFNPVDAQQRCERRLITEVARLHSVTAGDVTAARQRIPNRGLDLPVNVPMAALFFFSMLRILKLVERRFAGEPIAMFVSLAVASVALSGVFVSVGELWTSLLQMIRLGSHHVGGRVNKLPWLQHQTEIFTLGVVLFWIVVTLRWLRGRGRAARASGRT